MMHKEMHRHVMALLERYNIIYSWCRRPKDARAVFYTAAGEEFHEVWIIPIRSAISYATALHETYPWTPSTQPGYSGARTVGLALGKRECADLDARHGEALQRLLGLVRSAAGALIAIGKLARGMMAGAVGEAAGA